ncbi:MAG TPA: hypothetical protein VNJ07_12020 [Chitinophagales bacterium]|nr:hypothetical protein [Chitinophagales bacterium]
MKNFHFTLSAYDNLLKLALNAGYQFLAFDDPGRFDKNKVCLLRHDIDVDLGAALKLAEIEHKRGIRATYFVMLRSPVYNLFGRANTQLVHEILSMGHWLGLHYDDGFSSSNLSFEESVDMEASVLERMFSVKITSVSFHQPSQRILNGKVKLNNRVNTYGKEDLRGYHYISDSNKVWKHLTPFDIFRESRYSKVHLLIHPLWWADKDDLPTETLWEKGLLANWYRTQEQLISTERAYGKKRKFQILKA